MDNLELKFEQKYQKRVKIVLGLLLLGAIYLLLMNRYTLLHAPKPDLKLFSLMPQEVAPVSQNASYQSIEGMLTLHHWNLENGARVYFVPTPSLPMLDIDITFDAGAARNPLGKGGLAYLCNHLLNEGAGELDAEQIAVRLDELGVEFHTESHRDMAVVHLRVLTEEKVLDPAVDLLSLILHAPQFPKDAVEREKNNTLVSLKYEKQSPGKVAGRVFFEKLYGKNPYAQSKLGSTEEIPNITQADLKAFHQRYYSAQNAVITLVGAIDLEKANLLANRIALNLPQGQRAAKISEPAQLAHLNELNINFPSEQTHIMMGSLGMTRDDPDYYPLYLGNHILGGGSLTSRVFEIVRNQNGLAYSVHSYFLPMRATGPFVMACQTRGDQASRAQKLLLKTLEEFIQNGPSDDELSLAKSNLTGGYALDFDTNYSIARQVSSLGFYDLPLDTFNTFKEKITNVSKQDIQKAFSKRIKTDNLLVVTVGSKV